MAGKNFVPDYSKKKHISYAYKARNRRLLELGFSSYKEYLDSDLWKYIRKTVLENAKHKCAKCGERANQVHHLRYDIKTLAGARWSYLIAVCRKCHHEAEMVEGTKTHILVANEGLGVAPHSTRVCAACNLPREHGAYRSPQDAACRKCQTQERNRQPKRRCPECNKLRREWQFNGRRCKLCVGREKARLRA